MGNLVEDIKNAATHFVQSTITDFEHENENEGTSYDIEAIAKSLNDMTFGELEEIEELYYADLTTDYEKLAEAIVG